MNVVGRSVLVVTSRTTVRKLFSESTAGRRLSLRFVAGETIDEAAAAAQALNEMGAQVSLDHLGEHVTNGPAAIAARDDYLDCLNRIHESGLDANISVKLTQLGLGLDDELAVESLGVLAARAADAGTTVMVDMEESELVQRTVAACEVVQAKYGNVGVAVQSYLYRTPADLDRIVVGGGYVRLCKGAYDEPVEVAYQDKARVDAAFDALTRQLMSTPGITPGIATHDDERIDLAKRLAEHRSQPWEFQMLYGVRRDLQRSLLDEGYPVRIYVPYGTAWYPYLTRRMAERPANVAFFLRAAVGR
ncbi:MAG: proline dehydrogenase family protein [Actinomycetota bacterium]|nr:proline dehydrogenase family protein [Actinomycetota bacterium]